jgi:hypothetical protein
LDAENILCILLTFYTLDLRVLFQKTTLYALWVVW